MSGKHKARKLDPLPKRDPGVAGDAEQAAATDAASKGGGKVVKVNVRKNEKH